MTVSDSNREADLEKRKQNCVSVGGSDDVDVVVAVVEEEELTLVVVERRQSLQVLGLGRWC